MFVLVDVNFFYVSCEIVFCFDLYGCLVVVFFNNDGCVIVCSWEVKEVGILMGVFYFKI